MQKKQPQINTSIDKAHHLLFFSGASFGSGFFTSLKLNMHHYSRSNPHLLLILPAFACFVTFDGLESVRVHLIIRCAVNKPWQYWHVGEILAKDSPLTWGRPVVPIPALHHPIIMS
jgi:hypothetical protein